MVGVDAANAPLRSLLRFSRTVICRLWNESSGRSLVCFDLARSDSFIEGCLQIFNAASAAFFFV